MNPVNWISPKVTSRQVQALAGVANAVECIESLAQKGQCSQDGYRRAVTALLALTPDNDYEVFGEPEELQAGLQLIKSFCEGGERSQKVRYLVQVLYLQKRLMRQSKILDSIATGIEKTNRQREFYEVDSDSLALSLGDLYESTLSTMGFRIQIFGNPDYLSQQRIAAKVRTLIFSGVRFALLWRQLGGHSRQLLLSKSTITACCNQLL